MDNQNMNIEPKAGFFNKSYLKHIAGLLGLIVLAGGSFFVWDGYFSESAKYSRQVEENMNKYTEWEKNYNKAMTEDVYGGKTPQETLNMFIDALKKEDVELASKYFMLDTNEKSSNYLTRKKWEDDLKQIKEAGRLQEILNLLSRAIPTPNQEPSQDTFWFSVLDSNSETERVIEIDFNSSSKVWKIESI